MKTSCRGTVLVEALQGSLLVLLVTTAVTVIVMYLWSHTYINTEAFFLARARLYQNTTSCLPSEKLMSQHWLDRQFFCEEAMVHAQYSYLPEFFKNSDPSFRTNIQNDFTINMNGN